MDFPNSYQQAVALCVALGGEAPHDQLSTQALETKIKHFSALVKPSDTKLVRRELRGCGIDFVLWVDLSPKASFDRQLGRRWKNSEVMHINEDIEPYGIAEGEKAGGLVVRNNFKLKNKEE